MKKLIATTCLGVSLLLSGCGDKKNIKIDGLKGPTLNLKDNYVDVDVAYTKYTIDGDLSITLGSLENSSLTLKKLEGEEGTALNIHLAVEDIISSDWETTPPLSLPGGRPLPGVSSGVLPGIAVTVKELHDITIYVGKINLGVFIPVGELKKLPTDFIGTHKFYIGNKVAGNISLVGPDVYDQNMGVLLLLNYTAELRSLFQKVHKKYNLN